MLQPGELAPDFILSDENGDEISLTAALRDGPVILYFYPADFTPGCTKEACAIRDIHDDILAVGLRVYGVSPQGPESHARFRKEHKLPFSLICDPEKVAVKMYDVDGPFGVGVRRVTYLVGRNQRIEDAVQADLKIDKHKAFIEKAVMLRESAGLQSSGVADDTPKP